MLCACQAFFPRFFLSSSTVVTWLPDVTLGVRMRNRMLCSIRFDRRSRDHMEVSLGCSLRRPRPITIGNTTRVLYLAWLPELATRVLYLAWLLELALVICPFYFRVVSI
jgi:hypothetical protein